MASIETAYQILYLSVLTAFAVLIGIMLIRAVIGPRITDRILAVNMLGTMVICSIAILSRFLGEAYLVDVALISAMISFVAVLMLATTYLPADPKNPYFPAKGGKKTRRRRFGPDENGKADGVRRTEERG